MSTDIKAIYVGSLRNTHAAELQGLQQMERQLDGLEHYTEYAALLRRHAEVTRTQLKRIEQALSETGGSVPTAKETVTGTAGTVGAAVHALAQDETLKNLYAGYGYQFEQIGAYQSLSVIARKASYPQHVSWIDDSIAEEQEAARAVEALIEPVTERYLELTLSDARADS